MPDKKEKKKQSIYLHISENHKYYIPDKKETHTVNLINFSEGRKCITHFVCIIL